MADKQKVEFQTNIAKQITFRKMFKSGSNTYGKWYGWDVLENGEEKTLFATEKLQEFLNPIIGDRKDVVVNVLYKEQKNQEGKPFHTWEVKEALFDQSGNVTPEPKKSIATNEDARIEWKKGVVNIFKECLCEASEIAREFNENPIANNGFSLGSEDVRAIAVSMVIQFQKDK